MHRTSARSLVSSLLGLCKGSLLHPQWLSDRYHDISRRRLRDIYGGTVLDIGSGGSVHKQLSSAGTQLIRLDYPLTNQRYMCRPDVYADARKLPVATDSIDHVLLLEVLEHVESDGEVLSEIGRVLKDDGLLYLSVPFIYPEHDVPHDFRRWTQYGIQEQLRRHGFIVSELRLHGHSLIAAMQLFNLSLLEICRDLMQWQKAAGMLAALLSYPLCLACNLLALPLTFLPLPHAACLGFFLVAGRAGRH